MTIPATRYQSSAPVPFVPPGSVLDSIPFPKSSGPHPKANIQQYATKPAVSVPNASAGVSHPRPNVAPQAAPPYVALHPKQQHLHQRSSASHVPVPSVPYPTRAPDFSQQQPPMNANATRLPARPMGHGRSNASAPPVHIPPPVPVPIPVSAQLPTQFQPKELNHPPVPSRLPRVPEVTSLGLFAPPTPAAPPPQPVKPDQQPRPPMYEQPKRSYGGRRATVSSCQPVTLQHDPLDQAEAEYIDHEHKRLDELWEQEQEAQRQEVEEARLRYKKEKAEKKARRRSQQEQERQQEQEQAQMRSASPSRSRGKKSARLSVPNSHGNDSPVMNSHGIPTPPATQHQHSPSSKPHKRLSAREEQELWRKEMDRVLSEQKIQQAQAQAEAERERLEAEEERQRQETIRAYQRQQYGSSSKAARDGGVMLSNEESTFAAQQSRPRPVWSASPGRRIQDARRTSRYGRRANRDSGYLSTGSRSGHEAYPRPALMSAPAANANFRQARPQRYYGEGASGLREEGASAPAGFNPHSLEAPQLIGEARRLEGGGGEYESLDDQQVRKPRKMDEVARFAAAAWDLYEARWAELVAKPPKENSLRFVDIPWPSLVPLPPPSMAVMLPPPTPLQIAAILNTRSVAGFILSPYHSADKQPKARLRAALLRFHPDKVQRWMNLIQEDEREAVVIGVEIVVRSLNEILKKVERS